MSEQIETISNYKVIINQNITYDELDFYSYVYGIKKKLKIKYIYNSTNIPSVNEYELLQGVITRILDKEVLVNINFKSEGIIYINEFNVKSRIHIGDKIDVIIEKKEAKGQMILSYRKANILKAWIKAQNAYKNGEIIKGKIIGKTKGGMIVKILDYIEAFMPGSQIYKKPISNFESYFKQVYKKTMQFKIIKINHEFKNLVVSHKALIAANIQKKKKERLSQLVRGQVIKAKIKKITGYGVFCDLGGVDGLVHYTDISWKRINKPSSIFNIYDIINVLILDLNEKKNHVQLGIKQLMPHPWDELNNKFHFLDKVSGVVTSITEYGAFLELTNHPGVEAILHVSEMSWSNKLRLANKFVKIGEIVECVILTLDIDQRKMSLGLKQRTPDPWINVYNKYFIGSKHIGKIINYTIFGVFLQLEKGIDGLIPQTYISKYASYFFIIGNILDVIVLEVYYYSRRLILLKTPYMAQ